MLVSLFGTGMNFAGVTWYVLGATHSTVKVSLVVILVTLPGLVVPPFGGVLIDRVDRRYLGMIIDATRAVTVLGTAALAFTGRLAFIRNCCGELPVSFRNNALNEPRL